MTDNNRPPRKPPTRKPRGAPERRPEAAAEPRDDARVAKIMARAGLCSRRDAETWIAAGRVAVNGAVIESPALNIRPGDRVTVDGMPLPEREPTRLFLFHKPRGVVTTAKDPEGRQTIFSILPPELPRVVTVGRLDINTEGLMLLTNDGGLARVLELPATGWLRRYRVRANGEVTQPMLDALAKGISIEGIDYAGIEAKLDRVQGANAWLTMGLREGKNREIKRVLEHLGLSVTRLIRISFGPFQLGELPEGAVEEIRTRVLRDQLGEALAREAGVEFASHEDVRPARSSSAGRGPQDGGRDRRPPSPEPLSQPRPTRPQAGARAHVSVMRAARKEASTEGRRRTERGSTEDRKGRAVSVERISSAARPDGIATSRNARRFSAEKGGERPERPGRPVRARLASPQRTSFEAPRGERVRTPDRAESRSAEKRGSTRPERNRDRDFAAGPEGGRPEGRSFGNSYGERSPAPAREGSRSSGERDFAGRPRSHEGAAERPKSGFKGRSEGGFAGKGRSSPGKGRSSPGGSRSFGAKDRPSGGLQGRPGRGAPEKPRGGKPGGSTGRPRPPGGGRGKPRG